MKFEYTAEGTDNIKMPVIIAAAGSSTRMCGTNKQLADLCGKPVIVHTLSAFQKSSFISKIILVTRQDDIPVMQKLCLEYGITKVSDIVSGGADRLSSVLRGMEMLEKNETKVLIHDGARPLVTPAVISSCAETLTECNACLAAVKVNDTVKRADDDGNAEKTVDRSSLYLAQTPQGVNVRIYKKTVSENDCTGLTDDAAVMELAGETVKIVPGDRINIKITAAEDLRFAETLVKGGSL